MPQFFKDYAPYIIGLLQLVLTAVAFWYRSNVATKAETRALEQRIGSIEKACEHAPDAQDIAELRLEMSHHTGQMREFSATMKGARETISAQLEGIGDRIDGVTSLLTRAERMVDTLMRHLLERNQ